MSTIEACMYFTLDKAAREWGVNAAWLRRMIQRGYIQPRLLGRDYVVHHTDKDIAERLKPPADNPHRKLPEPDFADVVPQTIGYTMAEVARRAGVRWEKIRQWYDEGRLTPLTMVNDYPVFDDSALVAIETIRNEPPASRKRKTVEELTQVPEYKRGVPPLLDKEKKILAIYDGTGVSLADIGRQMGISRQAASALYNRALYKQRLIDSGAPPFVPLARTPKQPRLSQQDTSILQRVVAGKSNAQIAAELAKSGVTEATVQQRVRKWARFAEQESGTRYERVPLATYILTKYGVLQYDTTAA